MPSYRTLSRWLNLPEYRIQSLSEDRSAGLLTIRVVPRSSTPVFTCSRCGCRTRKVHDRYEAEYEDLPWSEFKVRIVVTKVRVPCPRCKAVRMQRLPFARPRARMTTRLEDRIARDCQTSSVLHVSIRWGISWDRCKAADKHFLMEWETARPRLPVRHIGMDEVSSARGYTFMTVLSDLERGRVLDMQPERTQEAAEKCLEKGLTPEQRPTVEAACIDMWKAFRNAVGKVLPKAEIVYDKFHVMQHVGRAVDETRRAEFFRRGDEMRSIMRGKRWLLLSRWQNLDGKGRSSLKDALSRNRRLFKAYYLKEDIHRLWGYIYPGAAKSFWEDWKRALRWQRMPAFRKLVATIEKHLDGILAHCRHAVRFGVVESINAVVKAIIRRARGYRDLAYLRLKVMWATANPVRNPSL